MSIQSLKLQLQVIVSVIVPVVLDRKMNDLFDVYLSLGLKGINMCGHVLSTDLSPKEQSEHAIFSSRVAYMYIQIFFVWFFLIRESDKIQKNKAIPTHGRMGSVLHTGHRVSLFDFRSPSR